MSAANTTGSLVAVGESDGGGKCLIIQTDVSPGDVILVEKPLLLYSRDPDNIVSVFDQLDDKLRQEVLNLHDGPGTPNQDIQKMLRNIDAIHGRFVQVPEPFESILQMEHRDLGYGLFPIRCRARHSCKPNAYKWNGEGAQEGYQILIAGTAIRKGEEVTVSYLNDQSLLKPATDRKRLLQEQRHFRCRCCRCASTFDDMRAFPCKTRDCKGITLANESGTFGACSVCGKIPDAKQAKRSIEQEKLFTLWLEKVDAQFEYQLGQQNQQFKDAMEEYIGKMKDKFHKYLCPQHHLTFKFAHVLRDWAINQDDTSLTSKGTTKIKERCKATRLMLDCIRCTIAGSPLDFVVSAELAEELPQGSDEKQDLRAYFRCFPPLKEYEKRLDALSTSDNADCFCRSCAVSFTTQGVSRVVLDCGHSLCEKCEKCIVGVGLKRPQKCNPCRKASISASCSASELDALLAGAMSTLPAFLQRVRTGAASSSGSADLGDSSASGYEEQKSSDHGLSFERSHAIQGSRGDLKLDTGRSGGQGITHSNIGPFRGSAGSSLDDNSGLGEMHASFAPNELSSNEIVVRQILMNRKVPGKVYILEFTREPRQFHELLRTCPELDHCRAALEEHGFDWQLACCAKVFVFPQQFEDVMRNLRFWETELIGLDDQAEKMKLNGRHVIVDEEFKPIVEAVVQRQFSRKDKVRRKGEKTCDLVQVVHTFLHIKIDSSLYSGPTKGPVIASTTEAHGAQNPRIFTIQKPASA